MGSKLRYTYRLRPGAIAVARLEREWGMSRWIWNQAVAAKRLGYWISDKDLTFWRNDSDTEWLAEGSVVAQQQTIRRFWATKGRKKVKKKTKTLPSLQYTQRGFSLKPDKATGVLRLHLPGKVRIPVVWSREPSSTPSSVTVYRDSLGHWYASFVVERDDQPLPKTGKAIGIDWGVAEIATTTSDAHDLPHPQHGKNAQQKLARYQRMMARRKPKPGQPASRGYKHAKKKTAQTYKKVARQRQDAARKWARSVARDFDHIAVEDFRPKFMAKNRGLARKAADAAITATKNELVEYALRAGRKVVPVPPAYTTMDCSCCGARAKTRLGLSERTFECHDCGLVMSRDKNSARVILVAAGFNRANVESVRPGKASARKTTQAA